MVLDRLFPQRETWGNLRPWIKIRMGLGSFRFIYGWDSNGILLDGSFSIPPILTTMFGGY